MDIGVIGMGAMGAAMARRLLKAGHRVTVFNRSRSKAEALVADGATVAATPAEAAGGEAVITMLMDDEALESVTFGADGILAGLRRGATHIGSGTVSIDLSKRLAEVHAGLGQGYVTATVLGRPPAAEAGELYVMAAGEAARLDRLRPVLEALGQRLFVVGPEPWQGNLVKLCTNFLIFSTIEQFGEVFAIAEKAGVARGTLYDTLTQSFFGAAVHTNYGSIIRDRAYEPAGAKLAIGAKDTQLMLAAGDDLGVPLPLASLLRDRFLASAARGDAERDFCVIAQRAEDDAGL